MYFFRHEKNNQDDKNETFYVLRSYFEELSGIILFILYITC